MTLIGPEVHLYLPFKTFGERVQIGVMLGGGGGDVRGTATVDRYTQECRFIPQPPPVRERLTGDITEVASHIFFDTSKWTVIGRIEPNVAFLLGSSMKVHLGAGFHYPGTTRFAVRATYFFPRAAE